MSIPAGDPQRTPAAAPPVCPYCKKDLPALGCYPYQIGSMAILATYCPECRRLLHQQIFATNPMMAAADPEAPAGPKLVV